MFKKWILSIPKRYAIVFMAFLGYLNINYLRTNLSMAIIAMTSAQQITLENGTKYYLKPEFNWNSKERAIILSSFNYGHILGPVGGVLTGKLGGSTIYGIAIALMAIATFVSPILLNIHFVLFFLANVLIGLSESFAYASTSQLWSRWAPPDERSKFISFSATGLYGGPVVSFIVAGCILKHWHWPVLYYVSGIVTLIWYWIWFFVVCNDPSEDRHMSKAERMYIKEQLQQVHTNELKYPWKKILTCIPFLAGSLCKYSVGTGNAFVTGYLPQFVKDMTNLDISKVGFISTIPVTCAVISMPLCGCLIDYLRKNKFMSVTKIHKLNTTIGLFTGTAAFIAIVFLPNFTFSIICLSVYCFFATLTTITIQTLVLDLAPRYAGLLNSFTNVFYTSALAITPTIVGFVVTNHSRFQWNICFLICSSIFFSTACFFLKFGSGELQPWANYSDDGKNRETQENARYKLSAM